MALPRETILDALKAHLEGITAANGFNFTVENVFLFYRLPTELNASDYPAIIIEPGEDRDNDETQGAQNANKYKRLWEFQITAGAIIPSNVDAREQGELLIDDIVKRLTTASAPGEVLGITPASFGLGVRLDRIQDINAFEKNQRNLAHVGVDITLYYDFRPQDL